MFHPCVWSSKHHGPSAPMLYPQHVLLYYHSEIKREMDGQWGKTSWDEMISVSNYCAFDKEDKCKFWKLSSAIHYVLFVYAVADR